MRSNSVEGTSEPKNSVHSHPEIARFVSIGYNSTIRCLQSTSDESHQGISPGNSGNSKDLPCKPSNGLIAIFVDSAERSRAILSQLPSLVATASLSLGPDAAIRLISLPKGARARLSMALGIPRVSIIGLANNTPTAGVLIDIVKEKVMLC